MVCRNVGTVTDATSRKQSPFRLSQTAITPVRCAFNDEPDLVDREPHRAPDPCGTALRVNYYNIGGKLGIQSLMLQQKGHGGAEATLISREATDSPELGNPRPRQGRAPQEQQSQKSTGIRKQITEYQRQTQHSERS